VWPFHENKRLKRTVFWNFLIHDDDEQYTVEIKDARQAKSLDGKGAAAILKHCADDGGDVEALISLHCSNEKGVEINGSYIEPEDLLELLRKCGEE
jgi:hypothetical protein